MTRFLILEISGRRGAVAIAEDERLLAERSLDETRRHARDLAPAVASLLDAAGWRPGDVSAVLVSHGPGSYTGLRVGIMSAKAFAYATGCALLAMDTFAAIALQAPCEVRSLDVIADAQQHKVYVQSFARNEVDELTATSPLVIRSLEDFKTYRHADSWVSGPGVDVYGKLLPPEIPVIQAELRQPRPASLLTLGLRRYQAGERDDVLAVEPLYLRPSSAEEKWATRG